MGDGIDWRQVESALEMIRSNKVPVPVADIAAEWHIAIVPIRRRGRFAAALALDPSGATIVLNRSRPRVWQRFFLAHALGHYLMHAQPDRPGMFYDATPLFSRDAVDREANAFAMHLLLPEDNVLMDAANALLEERNEESMVARIARRYQVPAMLAAIRLADLEVIYGKEPKEKRAP